jgi:hypothetical protein
MPIRGASYVKEERGAPTKAKRTKLSSQKEIKV